MNGLAGRLDRRVTVRRGAVTFERWAGLSPVAALAPGLEGEALVARGRWRVVMRADADVRLGDRLEWEGPELVLLRVTRDPATPGQVDLVAEERDDG